MRSPSPPQHRWRLEEHAGYTLSWSPQQSPSCPQNSERSGCEICEICVEGSSYGTISLDQYTNWKEFVYIRLKVCVNTSCGSNWTLVTVTEGQWTLQDRDELDPSATFDTVDYNILLHHITVGLSNSVYKWFPISSLEELSMLPCVKPNLTPFLSPTGFSRARY